MERDEFKDTGWGDAKSWLIVVGIAVSFLIWGLVVFFAVGDKGSPVWDYSIVEDIPGQSSYSTHSPRQFPGFVPHPVEEDKVIEQHIMGPGKPGALPQKGVNK